MQNSLENKLLHCNFYYRFRVKFNTSREGDSENIQLVIFEDVMTGLIGKSASMVHESLIKVYIYFSNTYYFEHN